MSLSKVKAPIHSTAGAIPVKGDKGGFSMEKVKVSRYVSGKRPDYAPDSSDSEEDVEFGLRRNQPTVTLPVVTTEAEKEDRRLRRLRDHRKDDSDEEDRLARHRRLVRPEVLERSSSEEEEEEMEVKQEIKEEEDEDEEEEGRRRVRMMEEDESSEEELDEEEIARRRSMLRRRKQQMNEEELMDVEEEKEDRSEEESSEYEEYTDSEEEENEPRLKPVFVRKRDRVTIQEKEREERRQRELQVEAKRMAEDRRRDTLRIVENEIKKDMEEAKEDKKEYEMIITDDENDEEEYESWKVRELKRIKRDREERENMERERLEVERLKGMTEEERRAELRNNPKMVTNKAAKGKYKFLQKYFHRGAFYLDEEDEVYKRDFSEATLEDHFDKTVLPKVMQVKNFGRSGRTKYTHLVDQDTTQFDSPWVSDTAMNLKFHSAKGGGMKQVFERPGPKKRK